MESFEYTAMAGPGERRTGRIEAESSAAAVRELVNRGYHILSIGESNEPSFTSLRRLRLKETAFLTRQLARLIKAGTPIIRALSILEGQSGARAVRRVLADLRGRIQEGASMSEALGAHDRSFGPLYVSLVKAGETGGMLEGVLADLAGLLQREVELRGKVRAALAYPTLMVVVGLLTVFFLLSFVIPRVTELFDSAGQVLPLPTLILIKVSGFFETWWWAVILAVAAGGLLVRGVVQTEGGREGADRVLLKVPLVGELLLKSELARFARVLGSLLKSGVPMLKALEATRATLGNRVLRRSVGAMAAQVRQGERLSARIEEEKFFPPLLANVVSVGEESGTLDEALIELAADYETEIERSVSTMVSLLEPALIITVGGAVGFIVLALLLPIFDLNEVIQ